MSAASAGAANLVRRRGLRRFRTVLAFLLAPGIAAFIGSAIVAAIVDGSVLGQHVRSIVAISRLAGVVGAVGYLSAFLFAVPLYLSLPDRVRDHVPAVVPSAGVCAAAPWLPFCVRLGAGTLAMAGIAFALGCVAGLASALIRGAQPGDVRNDPP